MLSVVGSSLLLWAHQWPVPRPLALPPASGALWAFTQLAGCHFFVAARRLGALGPLTQLAGCHIGGCQAGVLMGGVAATLRVTQQGFLARLGAAGAFPS